MPGDTTVFSLFVSDANPGSERSFMDPFGPGD